MGLVYKQLYRQIAKDRLFLFLLFFLAVLTSMSFFFVMFSVDGNMERLNALGSLTENQQQYKEALSSNTYLAYNFYISLTGFSSLVFVMFFYRFFKENKRQIGCIKALGFQDSRLQIFFAGFTFILSFIAALLGLLWGYFMSDILIDANSRTYLVTGLIKNIRCSSFIIGLGASTTVFSVTALFCYGFVRNIETGLLLTNNNQLARFSPALKLADKLSRIAPVNKRLSLRIALRKPLSVLLLFAAVMSFSVCIILGQSLNISSAKIFENQTAGHNYKYHVRYEGYQTEAVPDSALACLEGPASVSIGNHQLDRTASGLYYTNELYELKNPENQILTMPEVNTAYINPEFSEIYGVCIGDTLAADIAGTRQYFIVEDIAVNAASKSFYINGQQLSDILGISAGAYNSVFCTTELSGGNVTTRAQIIEDLKRNSVSNQVSGVINQSIGILVGAILIFLALYISFQDNTHDILILSMMGYRVRDIRKILIDVYLPVLWAAFLSMLVPSILLAKSIQKMLSVSTNDYMPFGINLPVVLAALLLINLIYWGVQGTFSLSVKKLLDKREITEVIYGD